MTHSDPTPKVETEPKPLDKLELEDLQLVALAVTGLLFDESVLKTYNKKANAIEFKLGEWLQSKGKNSLGEKFDPTLSVPDFYVDLDRAAAIRELTDIDDFPVLSPTDLTYTDPKLKMELHRADWQKSFVCLRTFMRGFGTRQLDIFVQPKNQKGWVYTSRENIVRYTSAWDSKGHYSPFMDQEGSELMAALIEFGRELQQPTSRD